MTRCPVCGGVSPTGACFCMHCAAPLPIACAACGSAVPEGARFCSLAPLGADAIREMLNALLGPHASTHDLAEIIHTRTGGNPFFTEEVAQNLIETGRLERNKGAYTLVAPLDHLEVPRTVHALLAARIDRLAEREKAVLQTAAVIGREFDEPTGHADRLLREISG